MITGIIEESSIKTPKSAHNPCSNKASMESSSLSFKLFIDTKDHKVLFAEAGKDVVDFLFGILTLPVGNVTRLLKRQGMVGALGNLYKGIENLDDTYMLPLPDQINNNVKDTLLKPKVAISAANVPLLLSNVSNNTLYRCGQCHAHFSDDPNAICPRCRCNINLQASPFGLTSAKASSFRSKSTKPSPCGSPSAPPPGVVEGGFVKGKVAYMIMDDLEVKPLSTMSTISLLNKFNVKDVSVVEEKEINLSMDEGLKMLKASFMTQNVLTHVFLEEKARTEPVTNREWGQHISG